MRFSMFRGVLLALSLMLSIPASATTLYACVNLESLIQVKAQEKSGDEIYINVVDAYSNKLKKSVFVPSSPLYWRFAKNSSVKNITLWQGKLGEGESVDIIFTILERDLPPYNRDDRIGSMTLKLKNTNGVLSRDWISGLSTRNEALKNAGDEVHSATKFYMDGSGGIYEMVLQVKLS